MSAPSATITTSRSHSGALMVSVNSWIFTVSRFCTMNSTISAATSNPMISRVGTRFRWPGGVVPGPVVTVDLPLARADSRSARDPSKPTRGPRHPQRMTRRVSAPPNQCHRHRVIMIAADETYSGRSRAMPTATSWRRSATENFVGSRCRFGVAPFDARV
jgi:hypothetical protein